MNVRGKRKIGRRFLAVALSVCMLLTAQPNLWDGVMVQAAEKAADNGDVMAVNAGHEGHAGWTAITENDENAVEWTGGQYYLGKDVTMGTITVTGEVTLCLNGHTLTHAGDTGSAVVVESGGKLTLCDCKDNWKCESSFDEDAKTYSCSLTGSGGRITGGKGTYIKESINEEVNLGGGVYVKPNAAFYMNSGRITGCDVGDDDDPYFSRDGGGVYVAGGTFHMTGGFVDANRAELGGGVCLADAASFTMSGNAVIMDNEGHVNGGIYCFGNDDVAFNMESGKILGNKGGMGGGVFVGSNTQFSMTGGVIEGNTTTESAAAAAAAGLYCVSTEAKLSGGSIRYNMGSGKAAGGTRVISSRNTLQVSGEICITDNYSNGTASNVSLNNNGASITVTGALRNDIGVICKPVSGDVSYPATVVKGTDSYSVTEADRQHFSSDLEGYEVMRRETETGNELYLDVPPHVHDGNTYTALTADNTTLSDGTYYLSKDLEMETITTTGDVTLCLNGHTLKHLGDTGSVIVVESGTFTLCDCKENYTYHWNGSEDNPVYTLEGKGGCITGGKGNGDSVYGGGVYVSSGAVFNMESGVIRDNGVGVGIEGSVQKYFGGGVYAEGTFHMSGGFIVDNYSHYGGGVYISNGEFRMDANAVIMHNSAQSSGAGVICSGSGNFHMSGGKILGNISEDVSGGINMGGASTEFIMTDGAIERNIAKGKSVIAAGLYFTGTVQLLGGTIKNNINVSGKGGGVRAQDPRTATIKVSGNMEIADNESNNMKNNLFLRQTSAGDIICLIVGKLSKLIGIQTEKAPTVAAPIKIAEGADGHTITDNDKDCIASDNENYEILKKTTDTGNELYLAVPFSISANGAELSPKFDAFTTEYTASVANNVDTVGITATVGEVAADTTALTMQVNGGEKSMMISGQEQAADLKIGENTIKIAVTDADGVSQTYTLVITRADKQASPVTVTARKDGAEWTDCPHSYKLISDNGSTTVTDLTAVPDGTYKIYSGNTDTGVKVTVEGKAASATVEYHTVTFKDGNKEMTTPAQQIVLKGAAASVPADAPTKTGYTFSKWVTVDGGSTAYDFTKAVTGKTSVHASWVANTYQVTFHYHGADGGNTTQSQNVTYDSKYGTLPVPTRTGYTFKGWYTEENGKGSKVDADTTVKTTSAHTLHAYWLDETAPNKPVLQDGVTLPTGWTNAQDTIPLKLYDGVGVTALLVSVDGNPYVEVSGFSGGTGSVNYNYTAVQEGEHIYQFKAVDAAGNSAESGILTVKLDQTKPVIGTLIYENEAHLNFWHWIIGKKSMIIHVPVTDTGSGVTKISYTLTPRDAAGNLDSSKAETKTEAVTNGEAEITFDKDFRGPIAISCTDGAGNAADSVTVGKEAGGIIIEDNAPQIAFQAENAELLQTTGEYKTAPDITVTVTDNKDNAISAGIASVGYKIGNGSEKTVAHDYATGMVVNDSFTIPAGEISAGETKITVTATDNAGNSVTQNYTVKVHTHSGTLVQAVEPTCTVAGNKEYYTCTCGKEFSDSGCTNEITDHTEVIKNALGHDFTGKYQFDTEEHWKKCSRCPATDSREAHSFEEGGIHCTKCEFEKAGEGHTHTGELHERVEPTCTTAGNKEYYTCTCGKWFSDSSCTVEITDKSKIEIAALEHDFVMKHDQNEHWQQCSRCSLEQSRGPHEYDDNSDTDCNVCGYVRTVQHTHSGVLVPAVEPTCTEDGHEAYYTCSCGKWFSDSGCVNEIADHASVIVEKRGHDFSGGYQSDENDHWKVCSRCGETEPKEGHVYDSDTDTDCNQCGYRRNIENPGNVSKDVEKDEKAPDTVLSDSAEQLADIILTEEEKGQIGNGTDIKFILNVKDAGDTVSSGDRTAVQQALDGNTVVKGFSVGQYLDISLFKVIGDTRSAISQTARKLTIVINVPESLKSKDSTKPRTYAIIRVHDGVTEVLADLDGDADTVTIATDRFSAYALVYKEAGSGADVKPTLTPGGGDKPTPTPGGSDKPSPTPGGKDNVTPAPSPSGEPEKASGKEKRKIEIHSGLKAIQTGKKLQVSWGRVTGADGYGVYVQYCGKDFSTKSLNQVKSGKKTKITVKKVNGKKLDTTKNFKLYVVAWKWKNGKKSTLAKTLTIHVAGKDSVKYTNVKSIQVKKSSYTLKKGGTVTLHPKAVLYDKHKKQLSVAHCKEFRYLSSNKKVAMVTAGGKVKAKGTGECTIYVFAKNGCRRKIKIKVKK